MAMPFHSFRFNSIWLNEKNLLLHSSRPKTATGTHDLLARPTRPPRVAVSQDAISGHFYARGSRVENQPSGVEGSGKAYACDFDISSSRSQEEVGEEKFPAYSMSRVENVTNHNYLAAECNSKQP